MTRSEAIKNLAKVSKDLDKAERRVRALDISRGAAVSVVTSLRLDLDRAMKHVENPPKDETPRVTAPRFTDSLLS